MNLNRRDERAGIVRQFQTERGDGPDEWVVVPSVRVVGVGAAQPGFDSVPVPAVGLVIDQGCQ